jgi:hypothetical protein
VVPGLPSGQNIKFIAKFSDQRNGKGRIECSFDPIKKRYYDDELDDDDDPYLTLKIQRTCKRKRRRQMLEEGKHNWNWNGSIDRYRILTLCSKPKKIPGFCKEEEEHRPCPKSNQEQP